MSFEDFRYWLREPGVQFGIIIAAIVLWVLFVVTAAPAQVCQESPSNPRENAATTSLRNKIADEQANERWAQYVQGVTLSGCDGHDYILVMLYPNPPKDVLKRIPKRFHHIPVRVKVWPEHPRID
jgi:hypothetical protein